MFSRSFSAVSVIYLCCSKFTGNFSFIILTFQYIIKILLCKTVVQECSRTWQMG